MTLNSFFALKRDTVEKINLEQDFRHSSILLT